MIKLDVHDKAQKGPQVPVLVLARKMNFRLRLDAIASDWLGAAVESNFVLLGGLLRYLI